MKKIVIATAVVVGAGIAWFGLYQRKPDADSFLFVTVEKGTVESIVSSTGALRATSTVQVGTQVSGRIEEIFADFNDEVKQGQLITRIDPTLLEQEIRSAKIAVERSRAELDQATREMKRSQDLYDGQVITESEYTTAQYQLSLARASFESAQINLDKAERNLKYTEIRAPADGIVIERNIEIGQTVAASLQSPQLFLIAGDLSEMEILAYVDESDIGKIAPEQEVRFTVQAFPDRYFQGKVRQVRLQSTTQENVVNYLVAISVDNQDGQLLPGMTATVEFIVKRAGDVLTVSNAALRFQPTQSMREAIQSRRVEGESANTRGGSGQGRGRRGDGSAGEDRGRLWTVDPDGEFHVVPVSVGISDGVATEVSGPGVTPGLEVIARVTTQAGSGATNPFDQQSNQGGQRRGRPGF